MSHETTLKLLYWIRAEVLHSQRSVLAETSIWSFKRKCSKWWAVAQVNWGVVVSCQGWPGSLKWNTFYPLKYENEYAFQTFNLFLPFIKGPACICNLWLSWSYQALYFNIISILYLTEIYFQFAQTYFHSVSWKLLVTAIQLSQINYFLILCDIFSSSICLFLLISSPNLAARMVQYDSLSHTLYFAAGVANDDTSSCSADFAWNQCCPDILLSIALLLKNSLNPSTVPSVSGFPQSLIPWSCISCSGKMSLLQPEVFIQLWTWY